MPSSWQALDPRRHPQSKTCILGAMEILNNIEGATPLGQASA
jgi:hypothetical protein